MPIQEHNLWNFGGGALGLAGLLTAAIATHYTAHTAGLSVWIPIGIILFVAALPLIGAGSLLEAVVKRQYQVKLGYVTGLLAVAGGIAGLVWAGSAGASRISQEAGLTIGAALLICGTVNVMCARTARLLSTLVPPKAKEAAAADD